MNPFVYRDAHHWLVFYAGLCSLVLGMGLILFGSVSPTWLIPSLIVYYILLTANSAGFHRLFSHRSYETSRFWEIVLLWLGSLSCYGSSIQWTIVHTRHHRFSDTARDPHQLRSFWSIFGSNYQNRDYGFSDRKWAMHLIRDPAHARMHEFYWLVIIAILFGLLLIDYRWALFGYLLPVGAVVLVGKVFNWVAHLGGRPRNLIWHPIFSLIGEYRHEFHHRNPRAWKFAERWYHPDLGGWFISLIRYKHV